MNKSMRAGREMMNKLNKRSIGLYISYLLHGEYCPCVTGEEIEIL